MITTDTIDWDHVFLTLTRLLIAGGTTWAFLTIRHILVRPKSVQSIVIIPKAVLWFALVWNALATLMSLGLVVFGVAQVSSSLSRTTYGVTIGWSIFGLAWVLAIGGKGSTDAAKVMDSLQSQNKNLRKEE